MFHAPAVSLGPSLHSQLRSTPLTSLDLICIEGFIPVSIFADLFGKLSLASLVLANPQTQTLLQQNLRIYVLMEFIIYTIAMKEMKVSFYDCAYIYSP